MYLGIFIDLLLCLVVLFFIIRTAKKGFALSLFNILAFFGAFILSAVIARNLSGYIFSAFFEESVIEKINSSAVSFLSSATTEEITSFVSSEFPLLFNFSEISGIGINAEAIGNASSATASYIVNTLIEPIFVSLISLFVYIISLVVCIPVLRFIAKKIAKIFTVSLVGKINSVLGGILGVIKGVVVVFIICAATVIIMGLFLNNESPLFYGIQNSFIVNFVSDVIL